MTSFVSLQKPQDNGKILKVVIFPLKKKSRHQKTKCKLMEEKKKGKAKLGPGKNPRHPEFKILVWKQPPFPEMRGAAPPIYVPNYKSSRNILHPSNPPNLSYRVRYSPSCLFFWAFIRCFQSAIIDTWVCTQRSNLFLKKRKDLPKG